MKPILKGMIFYWFLVMVFGNCTKDIEERGEIHLNSEEEVTLSFAGGDGSKEDPYRIANAGQLRLGARHMKKHFIMIKDIDLRGVDNFNFIGTGPARFEGVFDGNGKKIKNLKIRRKSLSGIGFFGSIGVNGVVKNVGLEDIDIMVGVEGGLVGGLVALNGGTIENSYVTGNVTGGRTKVGGLAGGNTGTIKNSYATVSVEGNDDVGGLAGRNSGTIEKSYATGNVRGKESVGGLVGLNSDEGTIENSYATGTVTGNEKVGGLVGYSSRYGSREAIIQNSYATGRVKGNEKVGGLAGANEGRIIGKNYWKAGSGTQGVGAGSGANVFRKTEAELKELDAGTTGWSDKIWNFQSGQYPKLSWQ